MINGVGTQGIKSMTLIEGVDELINSNAEYLLRCNPLNIKDYEKVFLPFGRRPRKLFEKFEPIPWFNAYPIEIKTDKVFPLFLAICRGEETLDKVLTKIDGHCQKMLSNLTKDLPTDMLIKKNVVLLTDKWDKSIFRKYCAKFDEYKEKGILFIAVKVTRDKAKIITDLHD